VHFSNSVNVSSCDIPSDGILFLLPLRHSFAVYKSPPSGNLNDQLIHPLDKHEVLRGLQFADFCLPGENLKFGGLKIVHRTMY